MSNTKLFADKLGYHYPNYFSIDDEDVLARCNAIVAELANIDVKISEAQSRVMATQVGDLSLDYNSQIYHYRTQATQLLKELSFRSGIPLVFNKYDFGSATLTFSGGSVF
jgi:hypothetical protein